MTESPHAATATALRRFLPFLAWPAQWRQYGLRGDLIAGVTIALVFVPQALAYAQLASLPAYTGLYAALLPAVVGALFGSCGALSTGPVALTSVLTGACLLSLARPDSPNFLSLAILLALLSGLIQIGLGALRAGWLLNLLSRPVMSGFINAAALLICLSQLPPLLGLHVPAGDHALASLWHIVTQLPATHLPSALYAGIALLALQLLRRHAPKLPAVLLVAASATALSALTHFEQQGGAIIGDIPAGLPGLHWPDVDWRDGMSLLPTAFVIALVSFMEVTTSATVISSQTGQRWDRNQELIGQGLAKLASAFSGAMPVSSSLSRSALNFASGARTGLSSLIAAAFVLLTLLYLTPLLTHLPKPVLAAIILQVVIGLLDWRALARAWQAGRDDGIAALFTFGCTLAFAPNIQNGILAGLLLSLALMLYRDMKPRIALLGLHEDGTYRDLQRFGLPQPHPHLAILRFDGPLTFVTAEAFEQALLSAAAQRSGIRVLLVSAAGINTVDASGLHAVATVYERLRARGQRLAFCGLKKQVIDAMERTGLWDRLGPHAHYRTEHQALDRLLPDLAGPPSST